MTKQAASDLIAIKTAIRAMGGLKFFEAAAITQLSEDRCYKAMEQARKADLLIKRSDGEYRLPTSAEQAIAAR